MSKIQRNKKNVPKKENEKKKISIEEIEALLKDKKEELLRTTQKKLFLEKKINEKNIELDSLQKDYKETQNLTDSLNEQCNKYTEHLKEKSEAVHKKSVFYNYQNAKEIEKLEKEKKDLKMLLTEKHEETMNHLMSSIEKQRLDLDSIKNKNFNEIYQMNESFNLKVKELEDSFTTYLQEFESEKQEEIETVIEDYNLMEQNEITFFKNLYSDHIKEINEVHEELLLSLRKYYIELIKENIFKIKKLKNKINELDTNDKEVKNNLQLLHSENVSISNEIENLELKRENLKKDLKFYSKDFVLYKNLELIYNESNIHIKRLKVISSNMKEQINEVENELIQLSKEINVQDYFDHVQKENFLLKKKIEELNLNLEDVNKELNSYLNMHNIKEEDVAKVKRGTEFTIQTINKELDNLRYAEKKIKKKMKENINIYEKKFEDLKIQKDD